MKIPGKSKIISILLTIIIMLTTVSPALATGLTMNPEKQAYSSGEQVTVASSIYDGETVVTGGIDWYYADENGDTHDIAGDGDSVSFTVPANNSSKTVKSTVYAAYGAEKQWTTFDIAQNTAAPGLGTVKVRVVDNVQRLEAEAAGLSVNYREPFGEILPLTEVEVTEGLTIRDALESALATKSVTVYGEEDYISGIGPVTSADESRTVASLSEFDSGMKSGWMVTLNDWFINAGANTFTVEDGDVIELCYTCNLGVDLGADLNNPDTSLKTISVDKGILSPVFAPGVYEYTLTLPAETQIKVTPTAANKLNKVTIQSENVTYRGTDPIDVDDNQVITIKCGPNTYTIIIAISNNDQGSADAVMALISDLPAADALTLADRARVEAIRTAYDQLTEAQKALVVNYSALVEAENKIAQMDADNKAAADAVIALIAAIPAIDALTLADQARVEAARAAYNALSEEQKALVDNLAALTAAEAKMAALLNPGGSVVQNYPNDFLLSAIDLEMAEGERKEIVILDTPRVGADNDAFNRDDLIFDVFNISSVSGAVYDVIAVEKENPDNTAKGTRYYVKGLAEGAGQIKITYDGYEGQDAVIAVNVKKAGAAGPALETDIETTKYDILYFTGDSLNYTFNVDTDAGATVQATVNGQNYAAESGGITVNLKDGYNPIVITSSNAGGTTTKVYNIRAKKMAYAIENITRPGSQDLYEGDIIKISFTGLVMPVPKVSRIYNPAALAVAYSCSMPRYSSVSGSASQYGIATDNGMQIELTGAGDCILSDGHIDENWFGKGLYSETPIGDAPPVTGAGQTDHRFSELPDIQFRVKENGGYNPLLFTAYVENTEDIHPGEKVTINIPDLDIDTLAVNHTTVGSTIVDLLDSHTTFATDIPGLTTVKSENATAIADLEKLKKVSFIVPENTEPGVYTVKGGYVWVKYGPTWWTRQTNYFITKMPDIAIEVKEGTSGGQPGSLVINNAALKNKLALAAGKEEGYAGNLTEGDLAGITGTVDLSDTGATDQDMALMQYLKGVSAINLSGNNAITAATVKASTFDWTTAKSLDFSGCAGVTQIEAGAFKNCVNLTAITLPEGVAGVGDESFWGCSGLTEIALPDSVTALGVKSFLLCTNLAGVSLPEGLQSIGEECFRACTALAHITLPDTVTTTGIGTFYGCTGLTGVELPNNLQSIGDQCFNGCSALRDINLPDTVTALGKNSFSSCKSLIIIKLPRGIGNIGNACFGSTPLAILDARETKYTAVDSQWGISASTAVLLGQDAQLSPLSGSIELGEENLTVTHSFPQGKTVLWGSSDNYVASVADGVVTGVQAGTAFIYAKAADDTYSGICRVTVTDAGQARLQGLSLSGITLKENFDPVKYIYTAEINGDIRSTTVTASAADQGSTITVNNKVMADSTPSENIVLNVGANTIQVKVTSADETVTKTYTITIIMKAVYEGDGYVAVGNPALQERLAAAAGKESGYTGILTLEELAAISGTMDLSNANITDDDMAVMKYLKGVSAINLSGNPGITSSLVKAATFDWTTPKSLDFSDCTGVTGILSSAFKQCSNLTGIALPHTAVSLGKSSFESCPKLASVIIPQGVERIGNAAFNNCTAITEINLPDSINYIDMYGLAYTQLKEVRLPAGITELPMYCFYGCPKLTYVAIPGNVKKIGSSCFKNCPALAILDLRETNFTGANAGWGVPTATIVLYSGFDAGLSPGTATLKLGEETLTLAHSIPADKAVLWGSSDTVVAIVSNGVVTGVKSGAAVICAKAGDNSYSGICRVSVVGTDTARLQELSLSGITLKEAFDPAVIFYTAETGCHMTGTTVTARAMDPGSTIKVNNRSVADGVPSDAIALSSGANTIEVKVTTPDGSATKTYTITVTVKAVYEGEDYVAIANPAFKNKLATAAGKESGYTGNLTHADLAAITGAMDLSNAGITDEDMAVMKYLKGVSAVNLSGNTAITAATAKGSFFDWTIPKSLDFSGCTGITEIAANGFKDCAGLQGIILPDTVKKLGESSFYGCTGIAGINIPEGVASVGQTCFQGCTGLLSIKLPGSISYFGHSVFYGCTGLTEADLAAIGGTALSDNFFRGCTGITDLAKIKLPQGITSLPSNFFNGCTGLTKIELPGSINTLGSAVFRGCTGITQADLTGINSAGSSLFQDCTNLKTVKLSNGITSLPGDFFNGCAALDSIELPEGITSIGGNCFRNMKLTYLAVPGSVKSIGRYCFVGTPLAILNLRATNFKVVDTNWGLSTFAAVLFPGEDAGLSPASGNVKPGETLTVTHSIPSGKTIAWTSSNPTVATVTDGVVTGRAEGIAYIAAKVGDNSYSGVCTVQVGDAEPDPAVTAVEEMIGALPSPENITLEDKGSVEAARAAYNALNEAQQSLVSNLEKLTAAEERIEELESGQGGELIEQVREAIAKVTAYVQVSGYRSDWIMVGHGNAGAAMPDNYLEEMAQTVDAYFNEKVNTKSERVTDHERRALAIAAAGGDPRDTGGHDLIERIYNFYIPADESTGLSAPRDITFQGLNGVIYGLIALDSKGYDIPQGARYSRGYLISYLLEKQNGDGGWDLGATGNSDVDITAMTLTALAPYHSKAEVSAAVERGVAWLSQAQRPEDGGYVSSGSINSEAISQAVIALCANGVDPASEDFTKSGKNLLQALLAFQREDGAILHTMDAVAGDVGMPTEQGYQALLAYDKFIGNNGVYDQGRTSIYYFGASGDTNKVVAIAADRSVTMAGGNTDAAVRDCSWTIKVVSGTVSNTVSTEDIAITGLPPGLTAIAERGAGDTILVTVSGTAGQAVNRLTKISIVVKSSAVTGPGMADSDPVSVFISPAAVSGPLVTVNEEQKDVTLDSSTPDATIAVPDSVSDARINMVPLVTETDGVNTATFPGDLTIQAVTPAGLIQVDIPANTAISAPASWIGTINVPSARANSSVEVTPDTGRTATVNSVIEVGFDDVPITFNRAIRIIFPGQAGRDVGYCRGESFTKITAVLGSDSQAAGDALPAGGDGKIDIGNDLVIWTKHFTRFVTYTQKAVGEDINENGGGGSDSNVTVKMRIEGYRGTVMDGYVTFNPGDYKGEDGKYHFTGPGGEEYVNDRATVLMATVAAWNQNGVTDNSVGFEDNYVSRMAGEEEFDFKGKHITSGWLVRVNNYLISQGVGVWPVKDGDRIEWYYGDVNSYFGSLEVSPTNLKTGEKIKVNVFGQSNGGMGMSNTSNKEPMEEAAVYVGSEEYTTGANGEVEITMNTPGTFEVYSVKLDEDAENEGGGYCFPLMSRTEKVRVTVSGESVAAEIPVPENTADAAVIIKEALASEESGEALVAGTVKAAAASLVNGLKEVGTAGDAEQLLKDTAAVTGLLGQAAGRITSGEQALSFTGSCREIAGVLAGLAPQISGGQDQAVLALASAQALDAAAGLLGRIDDRGGLAEAVNGLLDSAAQILGSLSGQDAAAVQESVLSLARQAARCLVKESLSGDLLKVEGEVLKAAIDPGQAGELAGYAGQTVAGLEQKLKQMGFGQDLQLDRQAIIDISGQGEKTVQITLSAGTMASVAAKGASSLAINTPEAAFSITPETFGEETKDKDIVLSAARVDPVSLNNPAVGPDSIVVDLNAAAGGQAITGFNMPLEVGIPYPGTPADPTAVTVYLIKDDGSLEPVGGTYDPASGLVKFLAEHFSKYFARETKKQFTDLADYPWAREAVETLAGKGIISGKGNGLFDPGAGVTRAEFSSLVTRLLGQKAPEDTRLPFRDVDKASWYHDAVAAAYAGGLVSGESPDRFNPGGNITREEMAVIIARVLEQKGYPGGRTEDLAVFKDQGQISSWAQEEAALAVREGIISGVGDGRFAPADRGTRAEAAVMLYKLYGLVLQ